MFWGNEKFFSFFASLLLFYFRQGKCFDERGGSSADLEKTTPDNDQSGPDLVLRWFSLVEFFLKEPLLLGVLQNYVF